MAREPEIARPPGWKPTARPGIDAAKLGRLQTARHEARAVLDTMNRERHGQRDDIQQALLMFPASPAAAAFWRPNDSTDIFLQMTGDQAEKFKHEAQAARGIAQMRESLAALTTRIDQLAARLAQLNKLVAACEAYAHGKE